MFSVPISEQLRATSVRTLASLSVGVGSSPFAGITNKAAHLCAGLGLLATSTYRALGGTKHTAEVAEAAALLGLLTKIDDQIIDSLPHHGGWRAERSNLAQRTEAVLAPTLSALSGELSIGPHPSRRVQLASLLHQKLHHLSAHPERLEQLLLLCKQGWATQVQAVCVFTSHPSEVSLEEVAYVTEAISHDWLLMISLIGTLPEDAVRTLTNEELSGFRTWGLAIQGADALADLDKDLADGHLCTLPGKRAFEQQPERYLRAVEAGAAEVYSLFSELGVDVGLLPSKATLHSVMYSQRHLNGLPHTLHWIHSFLLYRYTIHPLSCRRELGGFTPFAVDHRAYLEPLCLAL